MITFNYYIKFEDRPVPIIGTNNEGIFRNWLPIWIQIKVIDADNKMSSQYISINIYKFKPYNIKSKNRC